MLSTQYQKDFERVIDDLTPVLTSMCKLDVPTAQAYLKLYLIEAPFDLKGLNQIATLDVDSQWKFYRQHMLSLIAQYNLQSFRLPPVFN